MSDLVKRLREAALKWSYGSLFSEAADALEVADDCHRISCENLAEIEVERLAALDRAETAEARILKLEVECNRYWKCLDRLAGVTLAPRRDGTRARSTLDDALGEVFDALGVDADAKHGEGG